MTVDLDRLDRLHAEAVSNKGGDFEVDTDEAFRIAMMEHYPALRDELRAARDLLRCIGERDIEHQHECQVWLSWGDCTCGVWEIEQAIDEATK